MLQNGRGSGRTLLCSISFLPSPQPSGFTDVDAGSDVSRTLQNKAHVSFTGSVWKMTAITLFQVVQQSSFHLPNWFLQVRIGPVLDSCG